MVNTKIKANKDIVFFIKFELNEKIIYIFNEKIKYIFLENKLIKENVFS